MMFDPTTDPGRPLQFRDELIVDGPEIAGDVVKISDDAWAIHGVIPVDGDVLLAEFDTYEEARSFLDHIAVDPHGGIGS